MFLPRESLKKLWQFCSKKFIVLTNLTIPISFSWLSPLWCSADIQFQAFMPKGAESHKYCDEGLLYAAIQTKLWALEMIEGNYINSICNE